MYSKMFLQYRPEKDLTKIMYAAGRRGLTPNEQRGGLPNLQLFLRLPWYIILLPYSINGLPHQLISSVHTPCLPQL